MARLLDLHIHPSLKLYYLPFVAESFHAFVYTGKFRNPLAFQTQYLNIKDGPHKVMLCAHYVIENGFARDGLAWWVRALGKGLVPWWFRKLTHGDHWETLLEMMDLLERSAVNTNRWVFGRGRRFKMVRSYEEIADLKANEIALIHAVEGSHALGSGPESNESLEDFRRRIERRVDYLFERGTAMITLAHFWDNMFSPQTDGTELRPAMVDGLPAGVPDEALAKMKRADWKWDDPGRLAEALARKMLSVGMLIDVAHTQEEARARIYELCAEYRRPVVASHNGLQHYFDHEYNLSDKEILKIRELNGVIGLILTRRWLSSPKRTLAEGGKGLDLMVENMLYLAELTGDLDVIGIGTDFDGLTDPMEDCIIPNHLNRLSEKMSRRFNDDEIDRILYGNSLRVLKAGWGPRRT